MTAGAGRRPVARFDIDWAPVARSVTWIPAEHRRATVDEATAMRVLRCTPGSLARLRALGLTAVNTQDGPCYDAGDLRNAALYSRSGRTEVEVAMGAILSFLRGTDVELFGERHWTCDMLVTGRRAGVPCLVHPPTPEAFGGRIGPLAVAGRAPVRVEERVSVPVGATLSGRMTTRGRPASIVDSGIRALAEEFLASGVRWHYLPGALKQDADAAFALGIGNCDTLSSVLAARLGAAGFATRVYRGWIAGITVVPHSWVEVVDGDERVKVIDPSLLLLSAHTAFGSPGFAARAFGAALSRIVPTRCDLRDPIAATPGGDPRDVTFSCRPARAPAGAGTPR